MHEPPRDWQVGRIGMLYRDLVPDRLGDRLIASHIRVPQGGPVPDYVHFHEVRFQIIYGYRGWVRVLYQDQEAPTLISAGDCVLQPPGIRHRLLACSDGLEVVEVIGISKPNGDWATADPATELPTRTPDPERRFEGQRFVHHIGAEAPWRTSAAGIEVQDLGLEAASGGHVRARVLRSSSPVTIELEGEALYFVLRGENRGTTGPKIEPGACFVVRAGERITLALESAEGALLEVRP